MKFRVVIILGITFLPFFAYSEGQDWMMSVDNIAYFLQLLIIYCMAFFVIYWGAQRILKRKLKISFLLLAALTLTIIHWEITKQIPLNESLEKYLNPKDVDTTTIQ